MDQHASFTYADSQAKQRSASSMAAPMNRKSSSYTALDSLIMAAMIDETAAAVAAATGAPGSGYYPTGRGLAYYRAGEYNSQTTTSTSYSHSQAMPPPANIPVIDPACSSQPRILANDTPPYQSNNHRHYPAVVQSSNYTTHNIPYPSNKSEWELYKLLESARLLNYFGTFLNFGGDDVQQLSDADEEEFLEIMGLVGMTKKPLHVRRLQKALIDWKNETFREEEGIDIMDD